MNTRSWLEKLVAFDTTSRNSNLALIECVRDELATLGVSARLFHSPDGAKANLFATLPASNGETQGGIVLSGHTDVVPVDGQQWSTNPFALTEKGGRLYGRGSCDMSTRKRSCTTWPTPLSSSEGSAIFQRPMRCMAASASS